MQQIPNIGELGEQLVAEWLQAQNWVIRHRRWRCRWGEIDLIAQQQENSSSSASPHLPLHTSFHSPILAFVEVKTRSRRNWDLDGRLAITLPKQAKLWRTAELFLAEYPELANLPCRFDVALVSCQKLSQRSCSEELASTAAIGKVRPVQPVQLGQPLLVAGYQLILQDYIQSAFD